jgi:hypothetical protein
VGSFVRVVNDLEHLRELAKGHGEFVNVSQRAVAPVCLSWSSA